MQEFNTFKPSVQPGRIQELTEEEATYFDAAFKPMPASMRILSHLLSCCQ